MLLARTYATKAAIPSGAEFLYRAQGSLYVAPSMARDLVAENPWAESTWNLTAQGKFLRDHGPQMAKAFAQIAGTEVGGLKPGTVIHNKVTVLVQRRELVTGGTGGGTGTDGSLVAGLVTKV